MDIIGREQYLSSKTYGKVPNGYLKHHKPQPSLAVDLVNFGASTYGWIVALQASPSEGQHVAVLPQQNIRTSTVTERFGSCFVLVCRAKKSTSLLLLAEIVSLSGVQFGMLRRS